MKWQIVIQDKKGKLRRIPLDHEYETEWEAESEAENIAAEEYSENDEAWSLRKMSKSRPEISDKTALELSFAINPQQDCKGCLQPKKNRNCLLCCLSQLKTQTLNTP